MTRSKADFKEICSVLSEDLRESGIDFIFSAYFEDEPTYEAGGEIREREALMDIIVEKTVEDSQDEHTEAQKEIASLRKQLLMERK